jgi:hypothetical protein
LLHPYHNLLQEQLLLELLQDLLLFFTTPAFIATAVSGVIAAFAGIPKFETGGIVGGASFTVIKS